MEAIIYDFCFGNTNFYSWGKGGMRLYLAYQPLYSQGQFQVEDAIAGLLFIFHFKRLVYCFYNCVAV